MQFGLTPSQPVISRNPRCILLTVEVLCYPSKHSCIVTMTLAMLYGIILPLFITDAKVSDWRFGATWNLGFQFADKTYLGLFWPLFFSLRFVVTAQSTDKQQASRPKDLPTGNDLTLLASNLRRAMGSGMSLQSLLKKTSYSLPMCY